MRKRDEDKRRKGRERRRDKGFKKRRNGRLYGYSRKRKS